jgi:hypothetical protein
MHARVNACEDARTVCMYVRHQRTGYVLGSWVGIPFSRTKLYTYTPWRSGSTLEQFLMRIVINQYCQYRIDRPWARTCRYLVNRRRSAKTEVAA